MNKEEHYKSLIEEIKLGILKHTIWLQNYLFLFDIMFLKI